MINMFNDLLKVCRHLGDIAFQVCCVRLDSPVQLVHRGGQGVVQSLDTDKSNTLGSNKNV